VKNALLILVLIVAAIAGGFFWGKQRAVTAAPGAAPEAKAEAKPSEEEGETPHVTRDAKGNAVITMSDELQGDMGIQVANPAALQVSPEVKGYGRVLDPAPLAALMTELALAQVACLASSNELVRLKTLEGQGNASTRALQAAEAAAQRDQLAVQSAKDRLLLSWGKTVAEESNVPAYIQSLSALDTVLVRIDLPVGEKLETPAGARLTSLSGATLDAAFVGLAPNVDLQMQGRGFNFQVRSNASRLAPGEAVVGYLKIPGEPLAGVVIPREAVVRTEGAGWVYLLDKGAAEAFTRTEVALDHPTEAGWFVTKGVSAGEYVVIKGAQQLLSIELKGGGGE
jgi:hypothetical protein